MVAIVSTVLCAAAIVPPVAAGELTCKEKAKLYLLGENGFDYRCCEGIDADWDRAIVKEIIARRKDDDDWKWQIGARNAWICKLCGYYCSADFP
ncbi:unnamed protein product [Linum trigynum]